MIEKQLPVSDRVSSIPPISELNIFSYRSSSELLNDYVEFKRQTTRHFSINWWSKRLGVSSSGILVNLLKKRRLLTEDLAAIMVKQMELSALESEFFTTLVAWEHACHASSISAPDLERRLNSIHYRADAVVVKEAVFKPISQHRHIAICGMLGLKDAEPKPEWIRKRTRLKVSDDEIQQSIQTLIENGFLSHDSNGTLQTNPLYSFETDGELPSSSVRNFHRESLDFAKETLESVPMEKRHFTSMVLPVEVSQVKEAKEFIEKFINDFTVQFETKREKGDEVYQINIQFVPLTETQK